MCKIIHMHTHTHAQQSYLKEKIEKHNWPINKLKLTLDGKKKIY